jgi:FkbM family methyltransferase
MAGGAAMNTWRKLRWGVAVVGPFATARGLVRFAGLRLRRPLRAQVTLRSGFSLSFLYPSQAAPILLIFGDLVDPEYPFLRAIARPDWRVVDVGAAIGQFTVFSAKLPAAVVHAFEPSSQNVESLKLNLRNNRVEDRVSVHQLALSDHEGQMAFATDAVAFTSGLSERPRVSAGAVETVPVRRLDAYARDLGLERISVLKINVAGHEPEVVEGADELLRGLRADVLVLLVGLRSIPYYERLASYGYRFFFYHPARRTLHEVTTFDEPTFQTPPWPARHLIGLTPDMISGSLRAISIDPTPRRSAPGTR